MKKWWSKKGTWLAGLMVLGALSMTGCQEKKTEIVWYLEDPQWNGVDLSEVEPFQEIQNERFDLFNKRLEELGIPAKVVFKYTEEDEEWESYAELTYLEGVRVERLIEKDEDAESKSCDSGSDMGAKSDSGKDLSDSERNVWCDGNHIYVSLRVFGKISNRIRGRTDTTDDTRGSDSMVAAIF